MTPKTTHHYVGIEIECFNKYDDDYELRGILRRYGLENNVAVGTDGSIEEENILLDEYERVLVAEWTTIGWRNVYKTRKKNLPTYGWEFRVLAKQTELTSILKKLDKFLKATDSRVNTSCGLHIHIDCRKRNYEDVYKRLIDKENDLFRMMPECRRDNEYCRHSSIGCLSRYDAINKVAYAKYKTIEVRLHEGSIDTKDMLSWCKLLCNIADNKLTTEDKLYMKKRMKKYKDVR